jgi:hypothetical protein
MNVFEKAIGDGRIASEEDLKRLFWKCAKRIHPDASGIEENHERFIRLKADFDEAAGRLRGAAARSNDRPAARMDRAACVSLFVDLLASNFPADPTVRASNKTYLNRVLTLNEGLGSCESGLAGTFLAFEKEMYGLKGNTTISNHPFNVVKLYLYRFGDYTFMPNATNRNFLTIGYDLVHGIFEERNMRASITFSNWLLGDLVTKRTGER